MTLLTIRILGCSIRLVSGFRKQSCSQNRRGSMEMALSIK